MTSSLRVLLLGLTSAAIALVTLGELAVSVKARTHSAEVRLAEQTERLLAASRPLLLNALVVEDLASVEQTLRNLNADRVWRSVRLYERDGRTLMLDASPPPVSHRRAPEWFRSLLRLDLVEARTEISAPPTVYGMLAVTPSSEALTHELWIETRTMVTNAVVLLAVLIVLVHVILAYGLRPIQALGASATRVGGGDLTVRLPETRLAEIAPTVRAFNAMAENLEKLLAELRAKEAANRRLAASVEQAEDGILTVGLDGRVTSWNLGAWRLFDRPAEQALGRPLAELFEGSAIDPTVEARRLLETRPPSRLEFAVPRHGAAPVVLGLSSSPLHDEAGHATGYLVVARDVTIRTAAEAALRQAKEAAETANRAKAEFLATMSHEIRTPMNGVIGMTEILLGTRMTDEQREYAGLVKSSAQALLQIIDDILDFSKIEAGRVDLEAIPFDLRATVGQALKPLALQADEKGLELMSSVHPDVPERVVGDPGRLRQVLVNLVGNAVKFTRVGEVVVRIEPGSRRDGEAELHFAVRDTGIGVPRAKRDLVFEAFTQADGSTTRRYGGTGLGLPISKRLVELMRGRMWLESEEGQGSSFHFSARFGVAPEARAEPGSSPPVSLDGPAAPDGRAPDRAAGSPPTSGRRLRVLVAEDNPVNQRVATGLLEQQGHRVEVVATGRAALEALLSRPFDLVLMDIEMPELDGFAATAAIREHERDINDGTRAAPPGSAYAVRRAGALPIIALTAHALKGMGERCRAAGMDGFLSKPVRPEVLASMLAKYTGTRVPDPRNHTAPDADPGDMLRAVGGDRALLADLIRLFVEDCPARLAELRAAVATGDRANLQRVAHMVKGSVGTFGESPARELARQLEMAARQARLDDAPSLLASLETELERFTAALLALEAPAEPGARSQS